MTKPLSDYIIPGTNIANFSRWSRENIPKPPHKIPLGTLVTVKLSHTCERIADDVYTEFVGRARLIVVKHHEDCDGTALYGLSAYPVIVPDDFGERLRYTMFLPFHFAGFSEESLKVVEGVKPVELITFAEWKRQMLGGWEGLAR